MNTLPLSSLTAAMVLFMHRNIPQGWKHWSWWMQKGKLMLRVRSRKQNLIFITATLTRYFSETFWLPLHVNNSLWRGRFYPLMSYPHSPAKFPLCCNLSRAVCIQGASISISKPGLRAPTLLFSGQWLQHHTAATCSSLQRLRHVFITSNQAACPRDGKGTAPRAHLKALTSLHAASLFFTFLIVTSGQICAFRKARPKTCQSAWCVSCFQQLSSHFLVNLFY